MNLRQLNLAPSRGRWQRHAWGNALLLIAPIAMSASLFWYANALQARTVSLQAQLAARIPQSSSLPVQTKRALDPKQLQLANAVIHQLNLPWRDLLDSLEQATPREIDLLWLEPDAQQGLLRGGAEAPQPEAMLAYLTRLKQQDFFEQVALSKHEINDKDPKQPVRFEFLLRWKVVEIPSTLPTPIKTFATREGRS
jgi:Tfp pilus assembly protein PilN